MATPTCCLCGGGCAGRDAKVVEQVLHASAQGFVVAVDLGQVGRRAAPARGAIPAIRGR